MFQLQEKLYSMVNDINIEPENYTTRFLQGYPVKISLKNYTFTVLEEIYKVLEELLDSTNQRIYYQFLQTVLKELVQNGIKACKKRQFFKDAGIDIEQNYNEGIEKFKEELSDKDNYEKNTDLNVEVEFKITENKEISIRIKNTGEMTSQEKQNVTFMIQRGYEKNSVSELLNDEVQHKEGGGLGLSMIVVLMKSFQVPVSNFTFHSKNKQTSFSLLLPLK